MADSRRATVPARFGPEELGSANAVVGDVAQITNKYRPGLLVKGPESRQISLALDELEELLSDPELGSRCRAAAEALFSLEGGTEVNHRLYDKTFKAEQA